MKQRWIAALSIGWISRFCAFVAFGLSLVLPSAGDLLSQVTTTGHQLELTRAARPWEFISALGTRGALLGNESGDFEAWVYPLKVLRNFQLRFRVEDQLIPAKAIVRSISVRPEATIITYAWDTFSVRETLFVPVREAGAVIQLEIDTTRPLQVDAAFERDFQLEWPGTMGGSDIEWNAALHAFSMTENQQKFTALVGSPSATDFHLEYVTNYTGSKENSLGFGTIPAGRSTKTIVIAASFDSLPPADVTYKKLAEHYPQLLNESASYYEDYLDKRVRLKLPDSDLQEAYEWAQVGVLQGLVTNPYLGTGLVAGYRVSGEDQRPGYAWFFGRDALWTSLGLDAEGDFATTKTALEFLKKYQRADGKITHEIAQGAAFVPWFKTMPYAYASADATPLFIIAANDYVLRSGDKAFAEAHWQSLWNAYQFIVSTYDAGTGLPRNEGVGHGWIEGGPLYPARTELYQAAVVVQALKSLSALAKLIGKADISTTLLAEFSRKQLLINQYFWLSEKSRFAFALDANGKPLDTLSVLGEVPMWFGLLDEDKAEPMISKLSDPDIQTDWGMRIIPSSTPKYDSAGYHSGTVWPLFTGWAAVGEYRYHDTFPAYANLRANSLLTFDGSLGHVSEVLAGSYYQTLATGSPQQVWSSSMVISAMLSGLFGIDTNGLENRVSLAPHIPADWQFFELENIRAGACAMDIRYKKTVDRMSFALTGVPGKSCNVELAPALSLHSKVIAVEMNGRALPFHVTQNEHDQHVEIHLEGPDISGTVVIRLKDDFGLTLESALPALGSTNQGLRILSETWSPDKDKLTLMTSSAVEATYELNVWNSSEIRAVEGGMLVHAENGDDKLRVTTAATGSEPNATRMVVLHFHAAAHGRKNSDETEAAAEEKTLVH